MCVCVCVCVCACVRACVRAYARILIFFVFFKHFDPSPRAAGSFSVVNEDSANIINDLKSKSIFYRPTVLWPLSPANR